GVSRLADEVRDGHQQQAGHQGGLEDAEHLVERRPVSLRPVQAHRAQRERPDDQSERRDDERLLGKRQLRIRPGPRRTEAEGVGAPERDADEEHVEQHAERGEELVVPLEQRGWPSSEGRAARAIGHCARAGVGQASDGIPRERVRRCSHDTRTRPGQPSRRFAQPRDVAMADFLVALADFNRNRSWVDLDHSSLFNFPHRELGLSTADNVRLLHYAEPCIVEGARGCTVLSATLEQRVAAFPAHEIDPTVLATVSWRASRSACARLARGACGPARQLVRRPRRRGGRHPRRRASTDLQLSRRCSCPRQCRKPVHQRNVKVRDPGLASSARPPTTVPSEPTNRPPAQNWPDWSTGKAAVPQLLPDGATTSISAWQTASRRAGWMTAYARPLRTTGSVDTGRAVSQSGGAVPSPIASNWPIHAAVVGGPGFRAAKKPFPTRGVRKRYGGDGTFSRARNSAPALPEWSIQMPPTLPLPYRSVASRRTSEFPCRSTPSSSTRSVEESWVRKRRFKRSS